MSRQLNPTGLMVDALVFVAAHAVFNFSVWGSLLVMLIFMIFIQGLDEVLS